MPSPQKTAVVIPCRNESFTIGKLVAEVRQFLPQVFVIDDGSTDQTAHLAEQAGAKVLRHEKSEGKGSALLRGWQHAFENGFEWALSMDGDGQHAPQDILHFLQSENADLMVGNRMANPVAMPWLRKNVNRWMSRKISRLTGHELPDTQCGFRLMNLNAWSKLQIDAAHFEIESDVLLKFIAAGYSVKFVPVQVIYKNEKSKIHPVRDTLRWLHSWRAARTIASRPTKFEMETVRAVS